MSSVLLTMFVTRIFGKGYYSDVFSLAYSTALLLGTIGLFEVRQFQSSDVKLEFNFYDYLHMRFITCALMMLSAFIFVWIKDYPMHKSLIIIIVCLYIMTGALQDVYHGLFQLNGRLDIAGKSLSMRIFLSSVVFILLIAKTYNLTVSCVGLCVCSLLCLLYDLKMKKFTLNSPKLKAKLDIPKQKQLFISCIPLFACSFLSLYILNAPRYAIDKLFPADGMQTIYAILIMPAAAINLFSIFVFRPVMTPMAESFSRGDLKGFMKLLKRLVTWIFTSTAVCMFLGYILGIPVLTLIYGVDLSAYRLSLVIILLGGGISALLGILQYVITVLRKQYNLLIGYALAGIMAYFVSSRFIQDYGIIGGAISYTLVYFFLCLYFIFVLMYYKKYIKTKRIEL